MIHSIALHPVDQPLFCLGVRAAGCVLDLRINDAPIFREIAGAGLEVTLPVNEWLFRGENKVTCKLHPLDSPLARLRLEWQYRRLREPLKHAVALYAMEWSAAEPGRVGENLEWAAEPRAIEPATVLSGTTTEFTWLPKAPVRLPNGGWALSGSFSLPAPWPPCPWEEAASLDEQPNLKFSLWHLTQQFWGVLASRDPAAIQRLTSARVERLESAYHLQGGEVEDAVLFPRLLQRPEWKLAPLPEEGWTFELAGEGRMGRIVDERRGESVLRLINETEGTEAIIDVWWAFTHRWIPVA